MHEVEVKILEIDKNKVIEKLRKMGADRIFHGNLQVSYYDYPEDSLMKNGKMLRLRTGKRTELTFKQKISREKYKVMEEHEVVINDENAMKEILTKIGLCETKKMTKHRTSYVLKNIHFEIDEFPGIPALLEIEAPSEEDVKENVENLGFSMEEAKPWSGGEVIEFYRKKNI